MRLIVLGLVALTACNHSDSGGGDADARTVTCPASVPGDGSACGEPDQACVYEHCDTEGIVRASCTAGQWSVTSDSCEPDGCAGSSCAAGSVCIAQSGGAYLVMCHPHSCGDGPLTCDCVCGEGVDCDLGDTSGSGGEFTCYIDCGAEICP